jgi:hypothetical protein
MPDVPGQSAAQTSAASRMHRIATAAAYVSFIAYVSLLITAAT